MRILIVDDEPHNRTLLQHMLKALGECDLAVDGREAVEAFAMAFEDQRPYDLVLLDIMMPEMNGQDALKSIRAFEQEKGLSGNQEAVVFMVSALDTETQVVEAFFKGHCTDYVTKPINRDGLFAKLQEYGTRLGLDQNPLA
ncbi:MAG: response regulator [Magnetococcales bacterium]|nr:response regulator [Magnetococcales bacterium]